MDYFDLSENPFLYQGKSTPTHFLVIAFESDWLYPAAQSRDIVRKLKQQKADVSYCEIPSSFGHDSFLVSFEEEAHLIKHFLKRMEKEYL